MSTPIRPVLVDVVPYGAAELLLDLLLDYQATLAEGKEQWTIAIEPVDSERRGTVLYRVIQAARTVSELHPDSTMFLITEDGSRWRLPPPAL